MLQQQQCPLKKKRKADTAKGGAQKQEKGSDADGDICRDVGTAVGWQHLGAVIYGTQDAFIVDGRCTCPDEYNYDWADDRRDWFFWQYLQNKRYGMAKELLLAQIPIQLPMGGKSLEPLVMDGDTCFIEPIAWVPTIGAVDIAFCQVQPNSRYYVHLVWRVVEWIDKESGISQAMYWIGNNYDDNRKRCNGWCFRGDIFGALTKTQRAGKFKPVREDKYETTVTKYQSDNKPMADTAEEAIPGV